MLFLPYGVMTIAVTAAVFVHTPVRYLSLSVSLSLNTLGTWGRVYLDFFHVFLNPAPPTGEI